MPASLIVVAKRPAPGMTKTRLCPPLTGEQAAHLYECFLLDTLEIMRQVPDIEPIIAYLPQDAGDYFTELAPDMTLTPQRGASLGERLDNLLTDALQAGAKQAVVMNSDGPTLPVVYLETAFKQLDEYDVVIGPSQDGGYYLIGMKSPQTQLLRNVEMSTPRVLTDTLALAEASGLSVALLPSWYDVDTVADLEHLRDELTRLGEGIAPNTRRCLVQTPLHAQDDN